MPKLSDVLHKGLPDGYVPVEGTPPPPQPSDDAQFSSPRSRCPLPPTNADADSLRTFQKGSSTPQFRALPLPPSTSSTTSTTSSGASFSSGSSSGSGGGSIPGSKDDFSNGERTRKQCHAYEGDSKSVVPTILRGRNRTVRCQTVREPRDTVSRQFTTD